MALKAEMNIPFLQKVSYRLYFFYLLAPFSGLAQSTYTLHILTPGETASFVEENIPFNKTPADSINAVNSIRQVIRQLRETAFLEASTDSIVVKDSIFYAFLHIGPIYKWAKLSPGNVSKSLLSQIGFRPQNYNKKLYTTKELSQLLEDLLTYSENHGYPFSEVRLDSIQAEKGILSAQLFLDKKSLIKLDTFDIKGNVRISQTYLSFYLGLQEGDLFSREKILNIKNRLRELPFLKLKKDPYVSFLYGKAKIHLTLEKKNASRFDFLIGVLPNKQEKGKLLITGALEAEFHNQFGKAERIYFQFEQLRPQTQQIELQFSYPYVLNLPFGADAQFELYKRDTNFIDVKYELGLKYHFEGNNYLKAFAGSHTSTLLSVDTLKVLASQKLPDTLDISRNNFGLEYVFERLNYRFNPQKGFTSTLRAGAGIRVLKRNAQIEKIGLGELYDALENRSFQYRIEGQVAYYWPLGKTSTIKTALEAGVILSNEKPFANEQYRIGGNRLLRGFDEESVFASNFVVSTLEYRLLLDRNSYLYLFGDLARVDAETIKSEEETINFPYGFGAGISFETKAGIFGVSLAFGTQKGNPIDFSAPKVHFGFVSLF